MAGEMRWVQRHDREVVWNRVKSHDSADEVGPDCLLQCFL